MIVGVFGGSFDPVHNSHIQIARSFTQDCCLDKLILLPSPSHNLKQERVANDKQVQQMLRLAFGKHALIDMREVQKGYSCTKESLRQIRMEIGSSAQLIFALGEDSFAQMEQWQGWMNIFQLASILVFRRKTDRVLTAGLQDLLKRQQVGIDELVDVSYGKVAYSNHQAVDVSSTQIRAGDFTQVPSYVRDYIEEQGLYG